MDWDRTLFITYNIQTEVQYFVIERGLGMRTAFSSRSKDKSKGEEKVIGLQPWSSILQFRRTKSRIQFDNLF